MSTLLLPLIFAVWFLAENLAQQEAGLLPRWTPSRLGLFLAGYAVVVVGIRIWSGQLARRLATSSMYRSLGRFNLVLTIARIFIPLWLGVGVFAAGWGLFVERALWPWDRIRLGQQWAELQLPGLICGTLPALLTWMGLWWAQFPADLALREQSLADQVNEGLPVHAPPTFWQFFGANLRLQVLFIFLPILLIILMRDLFLLGAKISGVPFAATTDLETWVLLPAAAVIYIWSPEVLRRVLTTQRLEDSPLRQRLEAICRRQGLKYRDILIWNTQYSMGNAAVMGLLPRWRYILLSDLLLEGMKDQEIEAVFAHELGHIVYRHMAWYVVFFIILTLATKGFDDLRIAWLRAHPAMIRYAPPIYVELILSILVLVGAIFGLFGYLSRRFERQADVFAARMMQTNWGETPSPIASSHVGEEGAAVFASALRKVARINNIPEAASNWRHGSISTRMRYLYGLSRDPSLTGSFDRFMSGLYVTLILALLAMGALAMLGG